MASNDKHPVLKRCIDIVAWFFVAYPGLLLLWDQYARPSGPLDIKSFVATMCMFLIIPGVLWIGWRSSSIPPGASPFMDRFREDGKFRVLITVTIIVVWWVLFKFLGWIRPHPLVAG